MTGKFRLWCGCIALCGYLASGVTLPADQDPAQSPARDLSSEQVTGRQRALKDRYERFEKMMLQLGDYLRKVDPERSDLLFRAVRRSGDVRIAGRMNEIVELLFEEDFGEVALRQDALMVDLKTLLELLQSEDRRSELEDEIQRIEDVLKDVRKVIGQQKVARAVTERGRNTDDAERRQQKATDSTDRLIDRIDKHDQQQTDGNSSERDAKPPNDSKSRQGGQSGENNAEPDDQKSSDSQDRPGAEPGDGQKGPKPENDGNSDRGPQGGQPQQSQPDAQKGQQQTPGRRELERARQNMQEALEKLRQQKIGDAAESQDDALTKLIEAKEKLEEILRQMREEERELMLAALEARLRKMLTLQLVVNSGTDILASTPREQWTDRFHSRSRELSQTENDITIEAGKALDVLRQEGTSVSFPLAIEDVREDMLLVAGRLERSDVDEYTQTVERDIIEALDEMLESLQKELDKRDSEQREGQPSDRNGDPVLVDMIAELKMLRTLQQRINRRTRAIGQRIDGNQAHDAELIQQLRNLSRRQSRVQLLTEEIIRTRSQ